ncbi:MAG TPA: RNA polymerase subunit sigma-24, partial [Elusimicrobia bacterium]|nr:RNA polymerase subunit sigma-24 [Elusimicrobiota bacterium]
MSEKQESVVPVTDEVLIKRAKNGDNSAFEELMKKYEQKIYNLALRLTGNPDEAGDVLQETFLKAYHSLNKFKGEANFSTWLYRIALNIVLMKKRKEKGKVFESIDVPQFTAEGEMAKEIPDWSNNPEAEIENKEVKNILNNALASLPEEYRA